MPKTICLVGTHCTGKSTTLEGLRSLYGENDVSYITEAIKEVKEKGLPINEDSIESTQLELLKLYGLKHKKLMDNSFKRLIIMDRSVIDVYAYTLRLFAYNRISPEALKEVNLETTHFIKTINPLILWFRPEFELQENGVRSTNKEFQTVIDRYFEYLLGNLPDVYNIQGTPEARLRMIQFYIDRFTNV